jgi:DNA topoisomerase-1
MIWGRFVASQMQPAVVKNVGIDFKCLEYDLRATGQIIVFDGFTKVWGTNITEVSLPGLETGEIFVWKKLEGIEHETKPPARYTPATLVSELEKNGIGRPSTYASILNTLFKRKYIVSEKGALVPQEIGIIVVDMLLEHFKSVMDYEFTAKMEENLDEVAVGKHEWREMIGGFYGEFKGQYDKAVNNMEKIKDEETDMKCPKCGAKMVIRWGRNGRFFACSAFPSCKQTFAMDDNGNVLKEKETGIKCPKCQSPMIIKSGRYGKFMACSAYPACKTTLAVDNEGNVMHIPVGFEKCPQCGKDTVIRSGPKGKFLACTGFPSCRFLMELKKAEEKSRQ